MRRFARASLVPELGVRAAADDRETTVLAWVGWPLDRAVPRGLASAPSLEPRRQRERAVLRRSRARITRERWTSLRDAVDAALDLEEIDAELDALEDCR